MIDDVERRATIARLNDHFRFTGDDGWVFLSAGISVFPVPTKDAIVHAVRHFDAFTPGNDPFDEHDFGTLTVERHLIAWKITYYRRDHSQADTDAADPATTKRVLTIMLSEEY